MKVFNLTDVSTDVLEQYQMLNHTICVGEHTIEPGSSVEIPVTDEEFANSHLEHFLAIGAVAIGEVPTAYSNGKTKVAETKAREAKTVVKAEEKPLDDKALSEKLPSERWPERSSERKRRE